MPVEAVRKHGGADVQEVKSHLGFGLDVRAAVMWGTGFPDVRLVQLTKEYVQDKIELAFTFVDNYYNQYSCDDPPVEGTASPISAANIVHYEVVLPNQRSAKHNAFSPALTVKCKLR